jgi:GTP cyclohydrolase II
MNQPPCSGLEQFGIRVTGRIPLVIPATEFNRFYLETKATRSGHQIEFEGKPHLPEQDDPVIVEGTS